MRFFQEEKQSIWDIKFENAVKQVWQDIQQTKLIKELKTPSIFIEPLTSDSKKELKILNILIEHIIQISQHTLPEYFSIDQTTSLKDIINLIFSKFGNYLTHWEYQINFYNKAFKDGKIAEEDTFTHPQFLAHLANKTGVIEYSLITLKIYMILFNNIIKKQPNNNDNQITIPNTLTLKFYDISQLEELAARNVDLLISKGTIKTFIQWSSSPRTTRHLLSSKEINEKINIASSSEMSSHLPFSKN